MLKSLQISQGRKGPLYALLITLICASVMAQAADRPRLEAFLKVTGFDTALASIAHSAQDAPMMLGMSASDFGDDWSRTASDVFAEDVLHGIALDILEHTLSDDLLNVAAEFYASPLGVRLVAEENASHREEDNDMKQAGGAVLIEEATPERLTQLVRLTEAVDSSGVTISAIREVQVRFLIVASTAGVLDREIDEATLRQLLGARDAELRESLKVSGLNSAAYTYEAFSNAELAAYADALEAPQMQRVYELMNAIQFEIMAERFEVLALRMADMGPGQAL
ncbi:DUF2059 domain-containing protein [Roseovarius pelagicus]|uniref:DUF2059 domain-containing protein n=1 Tax=Roseovarius pelagicus TaxID=2980108 RepID=A0ABY6DCK4_9RHOB|nr:DUF2059 domain-containing protein [Roseovarius pelagicus]UXX83879.1 DUF2059 domain-containing protein [Roseovarius pelagicus]